MKNSNFWTEQIHVGSLSFPRFMAAPLDGITDSPFRQTIRIFSPEILLFSEMSHVASVLHHEQRTTYQEIEHPLCFQFSANKVDYVDPAVEKVTALGVDMINLNAGCPAKNVVKSGSGSALMADLPRLLEIIKRLRDTTPAQIPVTLKMRAGYKEKNALEVAQAVENAGIEMLIIHPRTQTEKFGGEVDYELVAQIKEKISIPLVFSGGISSYEKAQETYQKTGVDGFMVGRPIWGAPWEIARMSAQSAGNQFELSDQEKATTIISHYDRHIAHYGERGVQLFKTHLAQYIKGNKLFVMQREALLEERDGAKLRQLMVDAAASI